MSPSASKKADTSENNPKLKIALSGVHKSFGPKHVLRGIDLEIPAGKSMVIIGGSGTGKSVMLKCILGLIQPDKGCIFIDEDNVCEMNPKKQDQFIEKFGMLFQGAALFDSLKVWENVSFRMIHNTRMSKKDARDLAIEKITSVGLKPEVADLYPAELSGGMQKRVGLARAIAANPEIIFFDEPTTGLDPIMADVINDLICDSVQKLGATALSITHDMASAKKIADYVAMIHEGKIIWTGPVDDLYHSGNEYVDQFIHGRATGPIMRRVI